MAQIGVDISGFDEAMKKLKAVDAKQWPYILTLAANDTAFQTLSYLRTEAIPQSIVNPVPYTVNSSRVTKAKKSGDLSSIEAVVDWKPGNGNKSPSAGDYLKPLVFGGDRPQKRSEEALSRAGILPQGWVMVPTDKLKKDAFGNIPGAVYTQILSYLKANPDSLSNRTAKSIARKTAKRQFNFFVAYYGVNGWNRPSGIYGRQLSAFGNGSPELLFAFVAAANYERRFPFYELLTKRAKALFPDALNKAIAKALSTAR